VNDDFRAAIVFQRHKPLHRLVALLSAQRGMHLGYLALEPALKEPPPENLWAI
jgi:hypothetical protein